MQGSAGAAQCPSDCTITQYGARLSYAPLSETLLTTLAPSQRRRLEDTYRTSLDAKHRVNADLMTIHVRHYSELSAALSDLELFIDFVTKPSVFKLLNDALNSIVTLVTDDTSKLSEMIGKAKFDLDIYFTPQIDALMALLTHQQLTMRVLFSGMFVYSDTGTLNKEIVQHVASATRDVVAVLRRAHYVNLQRYTYNFNKYMGQLVVVVEVNGSRCENASKRWIELCEDTIMNYTRSLEIENSTLLPNEIFDKILAEWSTLMSAMNDLSDCLVVFSKLLKPMLPVENRWQKADPSQRSNAVELLKHLRRSPLLSDSIGERFRNSSVGIAEIRRMVNNETENTNIADTLRQLQSDIRQNVLDPLTRRLDNARDSLLKEYTEAFEVYGKLFRYGGAKAMHVGQTLAIWTRPLPHGQLRAIRIQSKGEYLVINFAEDIDEVAPRTAKTRLYDYFSVLSTDVTEVNNDLARLMDRVGQLLKLYKAFFTVNVTHADINQDFVRRVATSKHDVVDSQANEISPL